MKNTDLYQLYKKETGKNPDINCSFSSQCPNCDEEVDVDVSLPEFDYFIWLENAHIELLEKIKNKGIIL
jgi:hypothetical protein